MRRSLRRRKLVERVAIAFCVLALAIALLPLVHIVYTAATTGASKLTWQFFTQPADPNVVPYVGRAGGILNGELGTAILLFIGGLISVPLGVTAGMYLAEHGHGRLGTIIRYCSDTLLGVPSIIWGLFGFLLFTTTAPSSPGLRWDFSALAGGATLGLIMAPIVARVTELAIRDVPLAFREASLALGATRWATMRRISVRVAIPGIITGVLLALTNAIGQTVALLLTVGYTYDMPHWPLWGANSQVTDIGVMIYTYLTEPSPDLRAPAQAAILGLLALVLFISLLSRAIIALGRRTYAG
jgi:phosphate transport system permease protein